MMWRTEEGAVKWALRDLLRELDTWLETFITVGDRERPL